MPDGNYKTADMRLNILKSMELIARMKVSGTMEIGRKYMIDLTRPPAYHHHIKPPYVLTINGATTTAIIVAAISAKRKSRSRVIFINVLYTNIKAI
jgi:hypothetical protein